MRKHISRIFLAVIFFVHLALLTACAFAISAPPPYTEAESIYQSLALQDSVKEIWLEGAKRADAGQLDGGEGLGMLLLTSGLLEASNNLLQGDFHESLQDDLASATTQAESLMSIGRQWFGNQELSASDAIDALGDIDTKGMLQNYIDHLITLGFPRTDIDKIDTDLKKKLQELAEMSATP